MDKRSSSFRLTTPNSSTKIKLYVRGVPIALDKDIITQRSSVIASLVKQNPYNNNLFDELSNIPFDPETFDLVARFCHGYELKLSAENVIPLYCVSYYLGMSETHSPNNLFKKCKIYFEQKILPNWNESVKALRSTESIIQQAYELGLIGDCFDSLIHKAIENPQFLDEDIIEDKLNVKRKLFQIGSKFEDLTSLSLQLYQPLIYQMAENHVQSRYIASSLFQYAMKNKNTSQVSVIEAVEKLLPNEIGLLHCTQLFEMLKIAIAMEANSNCRNGFETRIGKQLEEATVHDLIIPSIGYSKEGNYDTECVKRILMIFYNNFPANSNSSKLYSVAELIENFLFKIAIDVNLTISTFKAMTELACSVSKGLKRKSDQLYKAIDIYLKHHSYLTESEREEICQVLDFNNLSQIICQHAAQNSRLPIRIVVQVLFVGQLHLRDVIKKETYDPSEEGDELPLINRDKASTRSSTISSNSSGKEEVMMEMEKMGSKMRELEKEYDMMKKEIEKSKSEMMKMKMKKKKEKVGVWKEMKRKLSCIGSIHDCGVHVKKKKKIYPGNSE
ncbi:BTB/POZ domain-containing protein At5g17580-like [Impatiens glandulifera]|uniref:BTB/POZ domain-containing protein At5g17580-like n=1 Tax=Impatiens glandulifera TaxID=253017 RepID=UPI001FB08B1E|nr:BTB/POZ domain-containing protein At5g17580-like [Impatiens glandulifera]